MKIGKMIDELKLLQDEYGDKEISLIEIDEQEGNIYYYLDDECITEYMDLSDEIAIYIKPE